MTPTLRKENPLSVLILRSNYRPVALILFIRPQLLKEELYLMLSLFLSLPRTHFRPPHYADDILLKRVSYLCVAKSHTKGPVLILLNFLVA